MAIAKKSKATRPARRGRERRGSERADARLSMRVEAGATGTARIVTESQNISASGVYCHVSHYLAPLSKVQLTIVLPKAPGAGAAPQELLKCDAIVVRCDQRGSEKSGTPYELACMFAGLAQDQRRRLEEFVTWRNLQALRAALSAPARSAAAPAAARAGVRRAVAKPAKRSSGTAEPAARDGVAKRGGRTSAVRAAKTVAKPAGERGTGRTRR